MTPLRSAPRTQAPAAMNRKNAARLRPSFRHRGPFPSHSGQPRRGSAGGFAQHHIRGRSGPRAQTPQHSLRSTPRQKQNQLPRGVYVPGAKNRCDTSRAGSAMELPPMILLLKDSQTRGHLAGAVSACRFEAQLPGRGHSMGAVTRGRNYAGCAGSSRAPAGQRRERASHPNGEQSPPAKLGSVSHRHCEKVLQGRFFHPIGDHQQVR